MIAAARQDRIEVMVSLAAGRIAEVRITARLPSGVSRFAQGRPATAVAALLPRMFALCAAAQGAAADAAIAAARGVAQRDPADAAGVASERMIELLRGTVIALGGPTLAGLASAVRALAEAADPFKAAVLPDRAGAEAAIDRIEHHLTTLGLSANCFDSFESYARWLAVPSPLLDLVRPIIVADRDFGGVAIDALSSQDDAAIAEQLARAGATFASRPQLHGRVPETGPRGRNYGHPVLAALGTGLWPRLLARLIEIVATPTLLRGLLDGAADPAELISATAIAPGIGLAAVECARGRLHHWVALDPQGRIERLEILAPTEWNFHAEGPLVRALQGAKARGDEQDRRRIGHLIAAFDACVGTELTFAEAGHA